MRPYEAASCQRIAAFVPVGCHVILLAGRGFDMIPSPQSARLALHYSHPGPGQNRRSRPTTAALPGISPRSSGILSCRVVVYCNGGHSDPWNLVMSPGLTRADWPAARIVAAYGRRFTTEECFKDEKNDPDEGFPLDCVRLSTPERWDRLLLVFAWAYYWLISPNGWGKWRGRTVKTKRTHALWRLGTWTLACHDMVWCMMLRAPHTFQKTIPAIVANPPWFETAPMRTPPYWESGGSFRLGSGARHGQVRQFS